MHDEMGQSLGLIESRPVFIGGGTTRFNEIREVIRCGLIGGKGGLVDGEEKEVGPMGARNLVETYVDGRPIAESLPVAWAVLNAAIIGVHIKKKAPRKPAATSLKNSTKA